MTDLRPNDPLAVGPFTLHGRLEESEAGVVYWGVEAPGRQAIVVLYSVRATMFADFRPRLLATVKAAGDRVLASDVEGAVPWVAVGVGDGELAHRLLAVGVRAPAPAAAPRLAARAAPRVVAAAGLAAILLGLALHVVFRGAEDAAMGTLRQKAGDDAARQLVDQTRIPSPTR